MTHHNKLAVGNTAVEVTNTSETLRDTPSNTLAVPSNLNRNPVFTTFQILTVLGPFWGPRFKQESNCRTVQSIVLGRVVDTSHRLAGVRRRVRQLAVLALPPFHHTPLLAAWQRPPGSGECPWLPMPSSMQCNPLPQLVYCAATSK